MTAAIQTKARRTQLESYPDTARRFVCLGIVVIATVILYYQFYLAGAVAAGTDGKNGILVDYNMSFVYYVNIAVVGYILGAVASFVTGIADKYGRVTIITSGLVIVSLLCLVGIPLADSKIGFAIVFAAIGLVEGMILVATPALIRDFSPQLGHERRHAMAPPVHRRRHRRLGRRGVLRPVPARVVTQPARSGHGQQQ
jgi:ACS family D-galactonate transporter-like MFS transporter